MDYRYRDLPMIFQIGYQRPIIYRFSNLRYLVVSWAEAAWRAGIP